MNHRLGALLLIASIGVVAAMARLIAFGAETHNLALTVLGVLLALAVVALALAVVIKARRNRAQLPAGQHQSSTRGTSER